MRSREPEIDTEHFDYRDWRRQPTDRPVRGPTAGSTTRSRRTRSGSPRRGGGGGTLVYSGDTGPCDALITSPSGADLLLAEAAFLEGPATQRACT